MSTLTSTVTKEDRSADVLDIAANADLRTTLRPFAYALLLLLVIGLFLAELMARAIQARATGILVA